MELFNFFSSKTSPVNKALDYFFIIPKLFLLSEGLNFKMNGILDFLLHWNINNENIHQNIYNSIKNNNNENDSIKK